MSRRRMIAPAQPEASENLLDVSPLERRLVTRLRSIAAITPTFKPGEDHAELVRTIVKMNAVDFEPTPAGLLHVAAEIAAIAVRLEEAEGVTPGPSSGPVHHSRVALAFDYLSGRWAVFVDGEPIGSFTTRYEANQRVREITGQ